MRSILSILIILTCVNGYSQWSNNPSTNNAICSSAGNQTLVQTISDGTGGAISTWVDTRNGTQDIYAQRINAAGALQWTVDGIAICNAVDNQFTPQLASDGAGGAIITWYDNRSGNYDIYAQRINAGGVVQWTTDGVAICTISGNQNAQQIIADGAGGAIIAWSDGRVGGPNADILAQRIDASGTPLWTAGGASVCNASSLQNIPQLISDGSGGAIITWEDWRNFSQADIYAQRISFNGFTSWSFNGVPICTEPNFANQYNTKIVTDGAGGAIICWLDNRNFGTNTDIYAQRVNASGSTQWLSNGVGICTANAIQVSQQMIADGSGGAIITWEDRRTERDIYAQKINISGAVQWAANGMIICDATGIQEEPQLVSKSLGGAILLWTDSRNGFQQDIYAQGINAAGTGEWAMNGNPVANELHAQSAAQLISNGADGAIVVWQDLRTTLDYDIYSSRILVGGTLPLRLLSFTATAREKDVLLSWESDNEINTSHFDIEFSASGMAFAKIGSVKSKNLPGRIQYAFTHLSPTGNNLFYRLKQVDNNDNFEYSKIIKINIGKEPIITVYPNPAVHFIQLKNCKSDEVKGIQVISSDGRIVMAGKANTRMQYDVNYLKAGVYILKLIKNDNSVSVNRFEKQ